MSSPRCEEEPLAADYRSSSSDELSVRRGGSEKRFRAHDFHALGTGLSEQRLVRMETSAQYLKFAEACRRVARSHTIMHCPLRPESRQRGCASVRSALCQKRTNAPQQKSHHSIMSSARVSSVAGSSRPSDWAVVRLTNSSIFVDCSTGKLASFSPFKTRPV